MFYFNRQAFEQLGGFDESLISVEGVDFAMRLMALGKKSGQNYVTIYRHHITTSCRKFYHFGDWYLFNSPKLVRAISTGMDRKSVDALYHDGDHQDSAAALLGSNTDAVTATGSGGATRGHLSLGGSVALICDTTRAPISARQSFLDAIRVIPDKRRARTPASAPRRCIRRAPSSAHRATSSATRAKDSASDPKSSVRH